MMRVTIVGYGGVGENLAHALQDKVELYVALRNPVDISELKCCPRGLDELPESDIYILAVSDSAVEGLVGSLPFGAGSLVVHTAGSVPMDILRCENTESRGCEVGVLYPMQSFTRGSRVSLEGVPLFLESEQKGRLEQLAMLLSDNIVWLPSKQRVELHLAAVFCSNFTNALLTATDDILHGAGLSLELYKPLIELTVRKVLEGGLTPRQAQTGPARRGDEVTLERHRSALARMEGSQRLTEIYNLISEYIWETSKRI